MPLFYLWEAKPHLSIIIAPPQYGELSDLANVYIVLGYAHWGLNLGQLHGYALSQPRDHSPIDIHIHHCYLNHRYEPKGSLTKLNFEAFSLDTECKLHEGV